MHTQLISETTQKLQKSTVAVVGIGATGTATARLLLETGIGSIKLIDRDFVDTNNLQHQTLFTGKDVGMPKAVAAKAHLSKISNAKITYEVSDLDYKNTDLLAHADIVLDCTDNFETRFLINDYCKKQRIPWIYAAVIRNIGTVFSVMPKNACFRCIFNNHASLETCDTAGVSNATVSATASLQAAEAIKILLGQPREKNMLRISNHGLLKLKVNKNENCVCCKGTYEYLSGKKGSKIIKLCGTNSYQVKGKPVNLKLLLRKLKNSNVSIKNFKYCLNSDNITIFKDGRALVKADSAVKAKSIYSRLLG